MSGDAGDAEIEHEPFSLNEIHSDVRRALVGSCDMTTMTANFRALNSNFERVYFAYDILKEHDLLPKLINVEKCDNKSEERRKFGNHVYIALKRDFTAMKHYNKSVAYAKSPQTLALAYGNRSAILFENKLYNECIEDIKNAVDNGYPEHLLKKINERKQKAEQQLTEQNEKQDEEYFTPIPQVTGSENKILECASDCIEMKNTELMGRHIVASRKIEPGDVIAVENPYAKVLLYEFYLTHCHHCLGVSYNLIPCSQCPLTLYCSSKCRESAWERYHRFECALLDTLHSIDATKLQLMALRVVLYARNEFSLILRSDNYDIDLENYKSDSYKEIHNLITNEEHRTVNDLFSRSVVAAVIFHLLSFTEFFEEFDGNESESIKKCTADLLLKHLQTAPSNMHEISELQGNVETGYENVEIAAGAYSFMSLLNHSCSPNVVRHCHGTTMVLRALRPIEIGQQLFDNYGYHHALTVRDERRTHLKEQYLFTCECEACTNDWPLYKDLSEGNKNFVVSVDELTALQQCSREMAEKLMPHLIENAKNYESSDPKKFMEILDNQEVLKQCFAIFGNKHTMFSN